jgi:hypothetical protein
MKIQSNVICAVSCSPKTTLLKIETVFAGKIFVVISAVFNFVSILTSLHHPSNIKHTLGYPVAQPLLCSIIPSPILADSGATHVLLRESVLPSLSHLTSPATLRPIPFTLPNLNLAATFIFLAFLSLSPFGLLLILPYSTLY